MNKVSKIITALLLVCYFFSSASVFAENKKSVTTVEERKQIEEYFVKALNGELENGKGDKVEETSSEVLETVQGKTLNVVERYTPTDSLQEVKAERKTAEQYISLLKKLDKEIGKIADDKKKTLAKLEADAKAEIKASYQEIEETTVQKFTERDADFAARKKGLKYAAMKTVNNKLEQEKQKTSLSYDQAMQNRVIEKNTLEKELTQIEFFEPATLAIGEFFRETSQSTLQYFPVEISNTRLSLNGFKGRLEIEKEDEEKALYINKNKANFKARVIYKVDVKNDYKLTLLAAEVIDKNNDKVLKRFEDFSYKVEPVKSKEETKKTVKKSKKRERYVNSLCNELIVSANNNFCNGFNNVCVNVQYLPLCLYNNHYSLLAFDVETRSKECIVIKRDELIPILGYLKKEYPDNKQLQKFKTSSYLSFKPKVIFLYENFSWSDNVTRQLLIQLCDFLDIDYMTGTDFSEIKIHIICRTFADFLIKFFIHHEKFVYNNNYGFGGYYYTLHDFKKRLIDNELISDTKVPECISQYLTNFINLGIKNHKIDISKDLLERLNTEAKLIVKKDLSGILTFLHDKKDVKHELMLAEREEKKVFYPARDFLASSIIAYLLDLTDVNPIKSDTNFDEDLFSKLILLPYPS